MWLTAFVVKSFAQAKKYIYIDEDALKSSLKWIQDHQQRNGCFLEIGNSIHKEFEVFIDE
jgi:hypothetical protein